MRFVEVRDTHKENGYHSPSGQVDDFMTFFRKTAHQKGIKVPKSVGTGGAWGRYWTIRYTSNQMRDLLIECLKVKGFTIVRVVGGYKSNGTHKLLPF